MGEAANRARASGRSGRLGAGARRMIADVVVALTFVIIRVVTDLLASLASPEWVRSWRWSLTFLVVLVVVVQVPRTSLRGQVFSCGMRAVSAVSNGSGATELSAVSLWGKVLKTGSAHVRTGPCRSAPLARLLGGLVAAITPTNISSLAISSLRWRHEKAHAGSRMEGRR